jgi:hypothetical protein
VSSRRLVVLVAVVAAAVLVGLAVLGRAPDRRVETGVVVFVDATGLDSVTGFTLRTNDGRTVRFGIGRLENPTQFPPSHLGAHLADGTPIRVTYETVDGQPFAVRLEDAVRAGGSPASS